MNNSFRIIVIGATQSTLRIVQGLVRNGANLIAVFSLDQSVSTNISGFATPEIETFCRYNKITFQTFTLVNDPITVTAISDHAPDLLFAVGFSQLLNDEILAIPTKTVVGFHPTRLPYRRGRAPLAWLTYDVVDGAVSFFVMGKGMDDGPVLIQEPFQTHPDDHAGDVEKKILNAIDRALDRWLPNLIQGEWYAVPQDEGLASYTGIRRPEDGLIDWNKAWQVTYSLIRATSHPHPGAYTYVDNRKISIWRARPALDMPWRGVPGRVLLICQERGVLAQAGDGLLWLCEITDAENPQIPVQLRVGQKLGYTIEDEIFKLKKEIEILKQQNIKV